MTQGKPAGEGAKERGSTVQLYALVTQCIAEGQTTSPDLVEGSQVRIDAHVALRTGRLKAEGNILERIDINLPELPYNPR